MDYSDARAAFFSPREGDVTPLGWDTPARRLRDALEPVATVCFWAEPAYDALAARGLDFLTGYVWGRGSQLGEASDAVVASAFGVFEPGMITGVVADGRSRASLAEVRAARVEGVSAALRAACGEPVSEVAATADTLLSAADGLSPMGRPFFAGLSEIVPPSEPWARLWHAATLLREHRGDAHLAACVAAGLDGVQANALTEAWVGWETDAYTGSRGWSPDAMAAARSALAGRGLLTGEGRLTDGGRSLRESLEVSTDAAEQHVVDSLGDDLDLVVDRLTGWGDAVTAVGWFPPDPYKAAAG